MAGVMFVACIPSRSYEKELNPILNVEKRSNKPNVKINQGDDVTLDVDCEQVSLLADESEDHASSVDKSAADASPSPAAAAAGRSSDVAGRREDPSPATEKSGKGKKSKFEIHPDSCMEEILTRVLKNLKIENYTWLPVKNDRFIHVVFSVADGPPFEEALHILTKWGVGVRCKSTLGIIPCALYFRSDDASDSDDDESSTKLKGKESVKSGWNEFVLSVVRSRLAVAQVVESVKGSAKLTFDFVCLIILAGTIAAVGLVENSTVSIVASMLISPLMGPILAGTFGTVIHDRKLQLMGVRNELIGLALTILVGFVIGLIIGNFDEYQENSQWPTQEMMSRGLLRSLWVGVLIALPSGAGVALGLLGDNSGSLIGVAISASLLPPAVNAGLLWALAALTTRKTGQMSLNTTEIVYSDHLPSEYALLGCVSLSLTLVNIICIFIAGIVVLRIKEVAPRALTDEVQQFWHHDIKVARDYNRSINKEDARHFEKQLAQELAAFSEDRETARTLSPGDDYVAFRRRLSSLYHMSPDTLRRISIGPRRLSQTTWSPSPSNTLENHRRSSLKDLEKLYASLGGSEPPRLSISAPWKVGGPPLRRGKQSEDMTGLSPIIENNGTAEEVPEMGGRRSSYLPLRRNTRAHSRFTVIPSACDPLQTKP